MFGGFASGSPEGGGGGGGGGGDSRSVIILKLLFYKNSHEIRKYNTPASYLCSIEISR